MKIRSQPGCTTEDIEDHIKSILRKISPDAIIINLRTNDVTNDKPTKKKIKKVVSLIENTNPDIQVIISGLIHRVDCEVNWIRSINIQLESYCTNKNLLFLNNNNMKSSCLAKNKVNLNKTGNSIFAKTYYKCFEKRLI